MEVHFDEKTIIVNDYKDIHGYGIQVADIKNKVSDKGQLDEIQFLSECLSNEKTGWPITLESMIQTTEVTFQVD